MSVTKCFEMNSILEVYLPIQLLHDKFIEYQSTSIFQKGIIVENLACLWARQKYGDEAKWILDKFAPFDLFLMGEFIDFKSTTKPMYAVPNVHRALRFVENTDQKFKYVLLDIECWDLEAGKVNLRVHHILNYSATGFEGEVVINGGVKKIIKQKKKDVRYV